MTSRRPQSTDRFLVVCDEGVPDTGHGQLYLGVRVELVAVKLGHYLVQEGSQLLARLGGNSAEAKRRALDNNNNRNRENDRIFEVNLDTNNCQCSALHCLIEIVRRTTRE